jgi:hypothetical protein
MCGFLLFEYYLSYMRLKYLLLEALADKHHLTAALKIKNTGEIFTGRNHAMALMDMEGKYPALNFTEDTVKDGFLDKRTQRFLSREEAYEMVFGAGDEDAQLDSGDLK